MKHLFYTPDISSNIYTLNEEESKHCIRVLRLKIGDKIQLVDGVGTWYEAQITDDNIRHCVVTIVEKRKDTKKRNWKLHIAIAPTKNMDRLEWFIEKATEIGIDEISLIDCDNSERIVVKTERLKKVAVSAMKQSLKAYLPQINDVKKFEKFISSITNFNGQKFIAHCANTNKIHLKEGYQKENDVLILIGPEGDFTAEEVNIAINNGFKEVTLGESRLRTETAGLYACSIFNILNE